MPRLVGLVIGPSRVTRREVNPPPPYPTPQPHVATLTPPLCPPFLLPTSATPHIRFGGHLTTGEKLFGAPRLTTPKKILVNNMLTASQLADCAY